ncbi:MAG: DUF3592 domain-containing protein [Gemmataceae bacterium]
MSGGAIFIVLVVAAFPGIIILAVVVKWIEVRRAMRWPQTTGKVIANRVESSKKRPNDPGYDFGDTEVRNDPFVEYEYSVGGKKYRCHRITIGERTADWELEGILARYPVGRSVIVYYDSADPYKAVLERDIFGKMLWAGFGCLMLFFIGGPLALVGIYYGAESWFFNKLGKNSPAPFLAALSCFGLVAVLFAMAYLCYVFTASRWPTVRGKIIESGVEAFLNYRNMDDTGRVYTNYKPSVLYAYDVNGHHFTGDRVSLGVKISSTLPLIAKRMAKKYAVGTEVDVRYNPQSPGESTLHAFSWVQLLLILIIGAVFTLVWAITTGRLG